MAKKFKYGHRNARSAFALGKLERAAMDALWDRGEISGSELYNLLGKKLKIRHNTLLTVLERLHEKGLLSKRKEGKHGFFKPILTRDEFCSKVADPIIKELLDISSESVISAFVDNAKRDPEKLEVLKNLIKEMERKKGE